MKKLRSVAIVLVIFGGLLLLFSIALSFMSVYNVLFGPNSIGIIGGADWPTAWLIFRTRAFGRYGSLMLTGLVSIAISVVLFIVSRKKKS